MKAIDLSLEEASRQALLLLESGDPETAETIARDILSFPPIPSLWTREETYRPEMRAFAQLRSLYGLKTPVTQDRNRGFCRLPMGALTLTGRGNGLGALQFKNGEVRNFGPQWSPWSDTSGFGIEMPPPFLGTWGDSEARAWVRPRKGSIPAWVELSARWNERSFSLDARAMGLPREPQLAMTFYICAPHCRFENSVLLPGGLHPYRGPLQQLDFGGMWVRTSTPVHAEVIPLAGQGSFWDASFLLAIPLSEEIITYTISSA